LPRLTESRSQTPQQQQQTVFSKAQEPRPVEIMSKTQVAGKLQYRVKYTDGKVYNCDWVNRPLLDHYEAKGRSQQSPQTQTWSNQCNRNVHRY